MVLMLLLAVSGSGWLWGDGVLGEVLAVIWGVVEGEGTEAAAMAGQWGVGWLMAGIALATLASEDLACIGAGLLAAADQLSYGQAVTAGFTGILVGDLLLFGAGALLGRPVLEHRWARRVISETAMERAESLFRRYGVWMILVTRFIPGTRAATYFSAGALHAAAVKFLVVFAVAAALWTPLLVGAAMVAGESLLENYARYEDWALPLLFLVGLIVYLILRYGLPLLNEEGRRRLRGKWIRLTRWEYLPIWVVNLPVVLYVVLYGIIRYRNPLLFTAANPGLPHSGFLGESKSGILGMLAASGEALPQWYLVGEGSAAERMEELEAWRRRASLDWPVVLKPDEGQRGAGVRIVRDAEEARAMLAAVALPVIAQEYVGGREYGIFYARKPSEGEGKVLSIVIKEQLHVEGDGETTLEVLLLRHPRAIAQLDLFRERMAGRLGEIPAKGERVVLGELGTHALGSLFLDGRHLETAALRKVVESWVAGMEGFALGRFDVKAADDEALREGRALRILELNGVTAEVAHIYDPKYGIFYAWRSLMAQWRLALEIGAEQAAAGASVSRWRDFWGDIRAALRRQRRMGPCG